MLLFDRDPPPLDVERPLVLVELRRDEPDFADAPRLPVPELRVPLELELPREADEREPLRLPLRDDDLARDGDLLDDRREVLADRPLPPPLERVLELLLRPPPRRS